MSSASDAADAAVISLSIEVSADEADWKGSEEDDKKKSSSQIFQTIIFPDLSSVKASICFCKVNPSRCIVATVNTLA